MKLTATAFRTQLFPALELAAKGDPVFITHKGRMFRVKEETKKTRLERIDEITPLPGCVFAEADRNPHDSPWDEQAWQSRWQSGTK